MSDAQAAWMRKVCAVEAAWHPDGTLAHLKLAPVSGDTADEDTQPSTPLEQARRERAERLRVMGRSSGGPVPRLSEDR